MEKFFKIENTRTRKTFDSLEEVAEYIQKKKPKIDTQYSQERDGYYKISENTIETHFLPDANQPLSESRRKELINRIKHSLNDGIKIYADSSFVNDLKDTATVRRGMVNDEVQSYLDTYVRDYTRKQGEDEIIQNYIMDNIDDWVNERFIRVSTNYKPCNGVGIELTGYGIRGAFKYYLLLREDDIIFQRFACYGRKVSQLGLYDLTDDDKF